MFVATANSYRRECTRSNQTRFVAFPSAARVEFKPLPGGLKTSKSESLYFTRGADEVVLIVDSPDSIAVEAPKAGELNGRFGFTLL
jgi:hypothetical protein